MDGGDEKKPASREPGLDATSAEPQRAATAEPRRGGAGGRPSLRLLHR